MQQNSVKNLMFKPFISIFIAGATITFCSLAQARPEPASSADDFVDRIGFATHWGYPDTPYGYAYEKVRDLLADLRVRHVRDGWHPRERELWEKYGIKTTMIVGPQQPLPETLKTLRDNRDVISMVEGPNEVDIFQTSANYKGVGFPEGPRQFQNELYAALKADPILKELEVIAPSTARNDSNLKLAPLTSFDYLVMHSYAGGELPSASLQGNVINNLLNATRILGPGQTMKPIVVTESGYHTALGANQVIAGVQPGISEGAQAKYLPRHFAEYFNAGIRRTISYEFINEFPDEATNAEASFGIVRRDLTPKPAYHALKLLNIFLGEANWDAATRVWVKPAVHLKALDYEIKAPETVHHTLLQKSDGSFYLLLWNEVSSFDTRTKQGINNPPVDVTLSFKTPIGGAALWTLRDTNHQKLWDKPKSITVSVPDEIVILHIYPANFKAQKPAFLLKAPQKLKSATTGTEATLMWQPLKGAKGYFVWRVGRYLGYTPESRFSDRELQPNTGYPYEVRALDANGYLGEAAQITAQTQNAFPDLVITEIYLENRRAGEEFGITATIKNQGNAPSPAITHGVAFFVDDEFVSWSDTFNQSLAPGQSVIVVSNNGPQGKKTFTGLAGQRKVRGVVDDVNRINESDETNNQIEAKFVI